MDTKLTDKQIHFYRENGFLVIDDFLYDSELAVWREAVDEAVEHHVSREDTHHNQSSRDVGFDSSSTDSQLYEARRC